MPFSTGPIIFDLMGPELSAEEREILQHPLIGGVIFFSRHYESPEQIAELCAEIRAACSKPLLLTVDQEGGRVQRFRTGFIRLPSMGQLGKLYENSADTAIQLAQTCGWLLAAELLALGIDLSFAPVLDLNKGINPAIGDRGFHQTPKIIITLAKAFIDGMHTAGMAAVGKHFPGHGSVKLDSHLELPIDERDFNNIAENDLLPFAELIQAGIEGIMAAHILFPAVDEKPVGFSMHWLREVLRKQLKFTGIIFSDDLNMDGAKIAGNFPDRAQAALDAGCDMALICNNRPAVIQTLDGLPPEAYFLAENKINCLRSKFSPSQQAVKNSSTWKEKYKFFEDMIECDNISK